MFHQVHLVHLFHHRGLMPSLAFRAQRMPNLVNQLRNEQEKPPEDAASRTSKNWRDAPGTNMTSAAIAQRTLVPVDSKHFASIKTGRATFVARNDDTRISSHILFTRSLSISLPGHCTPSLRIQWSTPSPSSNPLCRVEATQYLWSCLLMPILCNIPSISSIFWYFVMMSNT